MLHRIELPFFLSTSFLGLGLSLSQDRFKTLSPDCSAVLGTTCLEVDRLVPQADLQCANDRYIGKKRASKCGFFSDLGSPKIRTIYLYTNSGQEIVDICLSLSS